jgi:hypothetical protein
MSITALIVNYNDKKITIDSLISVVRQNISTRNDIKIILVENGCKKEEILEDGDFKHLILNKNYGFPAGVNIGVKACAGEWVLVLNNDCELKENFIEEMEKEIENNAEYQIFSPKIYQGENKGVKGDYRNTKGIYGNDKEVKNIIYACGDKIDNKGLAGNIGRGEVDRGQYDQQQEVPLASFACILIKKEILEKFPLDESYFGYYEDVDFCLRVAKAGYKIKFVPRAICYHLGEASFSKLNNLDNEMRQFRNLSFTALKNFSLFNIVRHWLIFNLKSFRYYFFMKKQWKFLRVEGQILKKCFHAILQ